jgi:hypothetical protein
MDRSILTGGGSTFSPQPLMTRPVVIFLRRLLREEVPDKGARRKGLSRMKEGFT